MKPNPVIRKTGWRWVWAPLMRVARVTTYAMFAFALLALVGARVLYADAREATQRLGDTLSRLADLTEGAETVRVNGARVHVASAFTSESVPAVLDRAEAACDEGRDARDLAAKLGTVREGDDDGGLAICFGGAPGPLVERLGNFVRTHDVAAVGQLRYVTAERAPDGRTRVRTIWTDGAIPLDAMFPASGDAPGGDSAILPRPPESRRVMVAAAERAPYAARIYRSTSAPTEVRAFYDRAMQERGFTRAQGRSADGAAYVKEGRVVLVAVGEAEGTTAVSLVEDAK